MRQMIEVTVKACCHGIQKKGENSDIDNVKTRHGIQRKGEESGLVVSSRVLSRDTEERRKKWLGQLKGVVMGC